MSPSLPSRSRKRRFRRRTVRLLVDFHGGTGVRCEYATTLCAGGLFIETEEPIDIGTRIKVRFRLPKGGRVHEIEGRVAWHRRAEPGTPADRAPGMAIEFIDAAAATALERDLESSG
jgi:type IV pilus assembly protein PilZ